MPRPIWKGSVSFGLVNIPVQLYPAGETKELSFRMLDQRDLSPIRQERVSDRSGQTVPWEDVVKGYRYGDDQYVVLTEDEIRRAYPKTTQTIEILAFVKAGEIDPVYFDKPYYLEPLTSARKPYEILRRTLEDTKQIAVAKIAIRTRQHLVALIPREKYLAAVTLRYAHELRSPAFLDVPAGARELKVTEQELAMAKQLVGTMSQPWKPEQYKDEYRDDIVKLVKTKAKTGQIKVIEEAAPAPEAEVVDIAALLKRSMERAKKERAAPADVQA